MNLLKNVRNNSALIQVIVWQRTGNMTLFEAMGVWFAGAYRRHLASGTQCFM